MILLGILTALFGLVGGAIALLPSGPAPAFMAQASGALNAVATGIAGTGVWLPWGVMIATAAVVFTVWAVLTGIQAVRWLLSWVPTMGGA